jgi:hypothetical protein
MLGENQRLRSTDKNGRSTDEHVDPLGPCS